MNPVLLLHGALGSKSQLDPLKHLLEQQNRVVYSLNFSGHSVESFSGEGFGIEIFSNDVIEYINKYNLGTVDLFGYSMGGYVALWLAHQHPSFVNRIITLGTKFDWSPESAAHEIKKLDPEKIELKVPAFARILQHRHAPNNWKELIHRTASMMSQLGESPLLTEEIFKSITQPVTILLGDQDDMADRNYSEEVSKWLPDSEFHVLENTPHPIEKVKIELLLKYFH
jgi:pimeloyl-ACP methyl ester carboxylesterase